MRGHPDRRAFGVGQRRPGNVDAPSTSRSPRPMRYDLPELGFHSLSLCLAPELEVGTVLPGGAVVCQHQEIERLRLALARSAQRSAERVAPWSKAVTAIEEIGLKKGLETPRDRR